VNKQSDEILLEHEYRGVELDWIAVDTEENIGYFSTAGFGPIPASVISLGEVGDGLEELVRNLPICTSSVVTSLFRRDITDWIRAAERGLFAFDWRSSSSSYELIARPAKPVSCKLLSEPAMRVLVQRSLLPVRLSTTTRIKVKDGCWVSDKEGVK
jgi:hypothetical protein